MPRIKIPNYADETVTTKYVVKEPAAVKLKLDKAEVREKAKDRNFAKEEEDKRRKKRLKLKAEGYDYNNVIDDSWLNQ